MAYVIGVTGGIGSGKTSATRQFEALGATVVDTDEIARALTAPGQPALAALRQAFGDDCFDAAGTLDRAALRRRVFADDGARGVLEGILHPLIRDEARRRCAAAGSPYVLLVVPLLLETGSYAALIRRTLVVDCPEEEQVRRVMARSGLSAAEVAAIMARQLPRSERLRQADDVLDNSGSPDTLATAVRILHQRYLALANDVCQTTHNGSK